MHFVKKNLFHSAFQEKQINIFPIWFQTVFSNNHSVFPNTKIIIWFLNSSLIVQLLHIHFWLFNWFTHLNDSSIDFTHINDLTSFSIQEVIILELTSQTHIYMFHQNTNQIVNSRILKKSPCKTEWQGKELWANDEMASRRTSLSKTHSVSVDRFLFIT